MQMEAEWIKECLAVRHNRLQVYSYRLYACVYHLNLFAERVKPRNFIPRDAWQKKVSECEMGT
jgi:hypothetical protein